MLGATAVLALPPAAQRAIPASTGELTDADVEEFSDMSLEELMNVEVTVASRTPQKIYEVPAAAYVIPGDEIRRSGHATIQEALRMAPGFYVSHWTGTAWDVTARGFGTGLGATNSAYLNQLLIMIDGVVVYSPLFAGTWWPLQDVDMADVDRIEIIRGPGGIVWGANTVHGVVNIITKSSQDTQGLRLGGRLDRNQWEGSARYGGPLGESSHLRVWTKTTSYDTPVQPFLDYRQDWNMQLGGFRADGQTQGGRDWTVWGRGYDGEFRDVGWLWDDSVGWYSDSVVDEKHGGQFAASLANPEDGSRWHAYYSRDQQHLPTLLDQDIDIFDLEYQRDSVLTERQRLTWGVGYQVIHSDLVGYDYYWLAFDPISQVQSNLRAFAVDTIDFPDQNLQLVLGAQALHTEFAGFDLQPNARLRWTPNNSFMGWVAVSRAVRTPSLEEVSLTDTSFQAGNPNFKSEELLSYEAGMRMQVNEKMAFDLATYFNEYDKLHVLTSDPTTLYGGRLMNTGEGTAYGVELAVDAKPTDRWSLRGTYSYSHGHFEFAPTGQDLGTDTYHPKNVVSLRSYYDLGADWEFDTALYGVQDMGSQFEIAEYWRGDVRIGWRPNEHMRFSLGVQDFNDPIRSEYHPEGQNRIRRAVVGQFEYSR